ncbi:hypothetical protein ACH5RR_002699 [Cinchona calisaya]|uniref:GAG-pre-integrase domain-containing protein n=1 Tax=Cinchona calisaya TaxID=153742 RepID=A0ABD3ASU5_9GENT
MATECKENVWFLDSGCSNHMIKDKSRFVELDEFIKTQVKMGNGVVVQAQGLGTIGVQNKRDGRQLVKIHMEKNRSFPINFSYGGNQALKAQVIDSSWLWHKRLGHLNFRSLKVLQQKGMAYGLPKIEEKDGVCQDCALGKQHRQPFPKGVAWRVKEILELVHTDVCGQMRTSHGGNKYFILFIDDFSRMTWVYFLKEKS